MQYVPPINGDLGNANRPYINANPLTSTEGSIPPAESIEQPMREIVYAIAQAGLTPAAGNTTQLWQAIQAAAAAGGIPKASFNHVVGFGVANNVTDATNDIDIAAGIVLSDDKTTIITLSSALTKRLDATFTAGNNGGGLDTGSKAASATYHVFVIYNPTTLATDVLFSTSLASPTLPSGFTKKRWIMSLITNSGSAWRPFKNYRNEIRYTDQAVDVNDAAVGLTELLKTLPVPTGLKLEVITRNFVTRTNTNVYMAISDPDVPLNLVNQTQYNMGSQGGSGMNGANNVELVTRTNTSAQVKVVSSAASTTLMMSAFGYRIDRDL